MEQSRSIFWATILVFAIGTSWGLYWIPVREIAALGLDGAWGVLAITSAALIVLLPFGWRGRKNLARSAPLALVSVALCGMAFLLYSVSLLYGRVAIVVILFFLTPVWSTLLSKILLGWPITRTRIVVLLLGIAGLVVMLGADGDWPIPRNLGEWLGLTAGFLWALSTVGIRAVSTAGPLESAFVLVAGAWLGAILLVPMLAPAPDIGALGHLGALLGWVLAAGLLGVAAAMAGIMWAATRLDPSRVGILLMAEVFVSAISAALIAGEALSAIEIAGGSLVLLAGAVEVWPRKAAHP
ncbi:DMT family transporter [Yoonia sp.]|uniref:DMT family transporter n=1 Tax=Yoonia sp. TaxID=2212373 RepID=UPI0023B52B2F